MTVVRLGICVRADRAETALAQLLPILHAGAEERELDGAVEYAAPLDRAEPARSPRAPERIVVAGMLAHEADEVAAAFEPLRERRRLEADGWAALVLA